MTDNISLHIKVIAGSTREGRFSDKAAAWIAEELKKQQGVTVEVLDLRDYDMPFFNEPMSPSFKQEPYKNEAVARFTKKIEEGDAFVMVHQNIITVHLLFLKTRLIGFIRNGIISR